MKKKFNAQELFDNNRLLQVLSLVFAVICWISIVIYENPDTSQVISQVPVTINLNANNLTELGLSAIEGADAYVDVTVRGPRTVVGNLKPEDLIVSAGISGISEPGLYDLTLTLANAGEDKLADVAVEGFSPSTIRVLFDRLVTQTYDVVPVVKGLSIEPNFVSYPEQVTPSQVTITGPLAELDKIGQVVVEAELTEPLSRSYAQEHTIQVLDTQGHPIDLENSHLTLGTDTAQLVVRVLKVKTLPLVVGFTNVPTGFPLAELERAMEISNDEIEIAGPVDSIDNYREISLGYIDLKALTPTDNLFVFEVVLPSSQFTNMHNITSVTVEFDTENWETDRFNVNNFEVENPPVNYDVTLLTSSISNVTIVGKRGVLESLTSDDIVVIVDLSDREILEGQYSYPVKITVPTKGMAWAVGDYMVTIRVTGKE